MRARKLSKKKKRQRSRNKLNPRKKRQSRRRRSTSKKKQKRKELIKKKLRKFWLRTTSCGRTKWGKLLLISSPKCSQPRTSTRKTWKHRTNSTRNWCRWTRPLSNKTWRVSRRSTIVSRKYMIRRWRTFLKTKTTWPLSSKWEVSRNSGPQIILWVKEKALPQPWPI